MSAYYAIIRIMPSTVTGEFVNVGVFTFGDGKVRRHLIKNWYRVQVFVDDRKLFAAIQQHVFEWWPDEAEIRRCASRDGPYRSVVQVSEVMGSTLDPDALLAEVVPIVLREPT